MATTGGSAELLRSHQHPQRAGFMELLFDVVFVFAFTRLSQRLVQDLNWLGAYQSLVLLLAMWWIWYRMAWTTNRYDPNRPALQMMVISTMFGSLLMAAALPAAFRDRGLVFATVFVAVQTLRHLWLVLLGGDRTVQLVSVRILFWAAISAVPWIAGIFAEEAARVTWWTLAVGLDYVGDRLDFPTPRLGRAVLQHQTVSEEHLTERYRQVLVVAFGETILASGIEFSDYGFERDRTAALVVAFATTVLLSRIYFYRAGEMLSEAIASSRTPARVGALTSYAHLVMVAGITLTAVGDELIIVHPFEHTKPAWILVIFGGPALFLVGRALLDYTAFRHISWSRPIGLLILAALAPATVGLPPIMAAVTTAAVLAGIAVSNAVAWRVFPREPAPPPR